MIVPGGSRRPETWVRSESVEVVDTSGALPGHQGGTPTRPAVAMAVTRGLVLSKQWYRGASRPVRPLTPSSRLLYRVALMALIGLVLGLCQTAPPAAAQPAAASPAATLPSNCTHTGTGSTVDRSRSCRQ